MRIGIDAHFIGNQETGNETYTLNLIRSLAAIDCDHNDYFLYFTNAEAASKPIVPDPRFHNRLLRPASPMIRIPVVFPWELARRPVDVLHTHYTVPPFIPRETKTVVTIHDISWEHYPELYSASHLLRLKTTVPWSARRADRILAVSHSVKSALVELYELEADKIVVTPLAASPNFYPREQAPCWERLRDKYGIQGRFILFVGNMTPRKNLSRVLEAFAWLHRHRRIEEKLVIVGPRILDSSSFLSMLRELQLEKEVICTGYLNQEELPDFYSAAEAFVFPSVYEAFGLPTLEAMACGTPVIASNRPAFPEVAGEAALLVDPEDWDAIANAIERVASDARLRQELRLAGLKRAREFSWQATAAQTLAVYQELAQGIQTSATGNPLTTVSDPAG
jgi:glycosyltransferase involved in cell wall biosynthesis